METRRIEANGLTHSVIVAGDGPCVLLLHGFPDTKDVWRYQIPALVEAGYRVIAPDLRGRGETDAPEGVEAYRMSNVLQDLVALLDVFDVDRAHVVGHDWGAATAWTFAMRAPQRMHTLTVLSVGHPFAMRRTARQLRDFWYIFMFQFPEAEEALMRHDWELMRAWGRSSPDADRYLRDLSRPGRLTAGINWYRANMPPAVMLAEPAPDIPPVTVPVMGIWSNGDMALREEQMTASAALCANGWRYERMEGVGHWLQLERPDETNGLLLDFLA